MLKITTLAVYSAIFLVSGSSDWWAPIPRSTSSVPRTFAAIGPGLQLCQSVDVTAATCCYTFESGTTICDIYSCMNSGPKPVPELEGPRIPIGESEHGIHHLYTCCQPNCGVNGCSPVCRECDL
ncbi:unnamed protein product [Notodromas monacha]|uniref:Uncharacterized protein n=1 Tax=Notodromas monacha TaxID=399045 RepID=A0A7R9C2D8_9CRUS|nr:unnamed protein product [Notodromas monacha]CAG0925172.1 unnamed protein product [Notodromas monacha]